MWPYQKKKVPKSVDKNHMGQKKRNESFIKVKLNVALFEN
jgi:hypothetical protein